MNLTPKFQPSETSAMSQAAVRFARRRSGSWSVLDESDFEAWLRADPSHAAAWASLVQLWNRVETARDDPRILAVRERARRRAARGHALRRAGRVGSAVAASLVLGIFVWQHAPHTLPFFSHFEPTTALVRDASTNIGERSLLALPDGSKVTLNTASAVHINFDGNQRRVTLIRGEAYFDVSKDVARPFVVSAGSRQIIAVGTAFDVRVQNRQVKVTLIEGRLRIVRAAKQALAATPVMLEAGSALIASEGGADLVERLDAARATSWRNGRLVFDGERLADVIAEMNRYSTAQLEIADPELAERKISGVFEPTDGSAFAKALEAYGIARATQQSAQIITLKSPQ